MNMSRSRKRISKEIDTKDATMYRYIVFIQIHVLRTCMNWYRGKQMLSTSHMERWLPLNPQTTHMIM